MSSFPKLYTKIKGVFYKADQSFYYFILPNVYHNDHTKIHTLNALTNFNNKIESHINDQKLNDIAMSNNINTVTIRRPLFQDFKLVGNPNNYTTFKCKSKTQLNLIVGLEYLLDVNCYGGQFSSSDEYVVYWSININEIKEVTTLDY